MRVLVIGLDGATWDLIKPWADQGELPTFKNLMENGAWGVLESTIPPWTIPAWESMATGKRPDNLGFASFMVKDGYKFTPYFLKYKKQIAIWDILSAKGYKVLIANLPNIHRAYKVNGCMLAGWLFIDKDSISYPSNLIDELDAYCNGYKVDIFDVDVERGKIIKEPNDKEYVKECGKLLNKHFLAFHYLLKNCKWDFAFIVFTSTDRLQHKYWDESILLKHYKQIDEKIRDILEVIDNKTIVFLVSDHGFGPVKYILNINEFLIREGYLKLKENKIAPSKLYALLKRSRLLPLARVLVNSLPDRIIDWLKSKVHILSFEEMNIDWKSTKAFAYSAIGDIYINIKGREPQGIVNPEEYYKIREELVEKIRSIEYKGRKLKISVLKKEEAFSRSSLWDAFPDLVILPTDEGVQEVNPSIGMSEVITEVTSSKGNHRLNGIILAYGPGIKKGYEIKKAKIYDLAPTILHIFGLPIPGDIDGRVLKEIFEPSHELAKRRPVYVDPIYYVLLFKVREIKGKISNAKKER